MVGDLEVSVMFPSFGRHARLLLPSSGSRGRQFPAFIGTIRSYDCRPSVSDALHVFMLGAGYLRYSLHFLVFRPGSRGSARACSGS